MVRQTLALAFVLLFCCWVTCAGGWKGNIGAQVGGGLTRAAYDSEYFEGDSGYGPGFFGGVTSMFSFSGPSGLGLETGLFIWQRGGETDFQVVHTDLEGDILWERTDTYDWRLSYVTFPLLLRYSFSEEGGLYLKAGPELAFLLQAELERPAYDSMSEEEPEAEITVSSVRSDFNFYDVSVLGAVGYVFPVGGLSGFVEASYVAGLRDVLDVENAAFDAKLRNSCVGLSVGVLFATRI